MEVAADSADVSYSLRVPNFAGYTDVSPKSKLLSCVRHLHAEGVRASFTITLNLFDTRLTKGVHFHPKMSTQITDHVSPLRSQFNSCSPRTKKASFKELYTYGGIEEVIYTEDDDSSSRTRYTSPINRRGQHSRLPPSGGTPDCGAVDRGEAYNVGVTVTCTHSSVPWQLLRHLQVTAAAWGPYLYLIKSHMFT